MNFIFSHSVLIFLSFIISSYALDPPYGQLKVVGTHVTRSDGTPVQLRGMALYWSQWMGQFWKAETIQALRSSWNSNVVRAAMGVPAEADGYLAHPEREYEKVKTVVDAAIKTGIYVIVDWHEEQALLHVNESMKFFANISKTYGNYPHILYEIWNEPVGTNCTNDGCSYYFTWADIKNYAEQVIPVIRQNDPNNIIIVGTPRWSGNVLDVVNDTITNYANIAYTWHYYTVPWGEGSRATAQAAINKGVPLFVTEYGTTDLCANCTVNVSESNLYWQLDDKNLLSYCNWHITDVPENTAALIVGSTPEDAGNSSYWTVSGKLVNQKLQKTDQGLNSCPYNWYTSKASSKKCYKLITQPKSFSDANNDCMNQQASFVSIDSGFENNDFYQQVKNASTQCADLFIGLESVNGNWAWVNGDTSSYRNWQSGYPQGSGACSSLQISNGYWINDDCSKTKCYVCQINL